MNYHQQTEYKTILNLIKHENHFNILLNSQYCPLLHNFYGFPCADKLFHNLFMASNLTKFPSPLSPCIPCMRAEERVHSQQPHFSQRHSSLSNIICRKFWFLGCCSVGNRGTNSASRTSGQCTMDGTSACKLVGLMLHFPDILCKFILPMVAFHCSSLNFETISLLSRSGS